jgi:hypothetical protein
MKKEARSIEIDEEKERLRLVENKLDAERHFQGNMRQKFTIQTQNMLSIQHMIKKEQKLKL